MAGARIITSWANIDSCLDYRTYSTKL